MTTTAAPTHPPRAFETMRLDVPHASVAGVTVQRIAFDFRVSRVFRDSAAFSALTDDEHARAARFLRHEDAVRYAATRVALRESIGARFGMPPALIRFRTDDAGRPSVVGAPDGFDFNVSHSGAFALIALAHGRRVGVDIESKRAALDWRSLAETVFAPQEHAFVAALPDPTRIDAFYDVWTAKEALLKAIGVGIAGGLDRFSVLGETSRAPRVPIVESDSAAPLGVQAYEACWCDAPDGYAACVAWSKALLPCADR